MPRRIGPTCRAHRLLRTPHFDNSHSELDPPTTERPVMKLTTLLAAAGLAVATIFGGVTSFAASRAEIDANVSDALARFDSLNPNHQALLQKAAGVLVFPRVTKAGAGIAGEHGQ